MVAQKMYKCGLAANLTASGLLSTDTVFDTSPNLGEVSSLQYPSHHSSQPLTFVIQSPPIVATEGLHGYCVCT